MRELFPLEVPTTWRCTHDGLPAARASTRPPPPPPSTCSTTTMRESFSLEAPTTGDARATGDGKGCRGGRGGCASLLEAYVWLYVCMSVCLYRNHAL